APSFACRKPGSDAGCRIWKGTGLASAKPESCEEKRWVTGNHPCKRCKRRPPENNPGQDDPRAEAVSHPSTRDFKGSVRNGEDADDPAPLLRADTKVFLNTRASNGDADAVEISDRRQNEQKGANPVAVPHDWQHCNHASSSTC